MIFDNKPNTIADIFSKYARYCFSFFFFITNVFPTFYYRKTNSQNQDKENLLNRNRSGSV